MSCTEEENAMEATPICQAWLRPDGGKGIRNKVLVLYTVECSKHVAESIAAHFQAQHRDVDVTGSLACLDNQAVVQRMLAYCVHPNVGAVLIVGHGCEYIEPDRIRDFARAHGRPAEAFYLQKVGGTEAGIALGCRLVGEMLEKIEAGPRAPMYAHELIIGAKCGGSDFTSGIAGNAVIGKFFENLTAAGGTAMMEEVAEAAGYKKSPCPLFSKRQRPCDHQALCGTTLVDVPRTPPHGLPAKSRTVTAATGAAYKGLHPLGRLLRDDFPHETLTALHQTAAL